MKVSDIHNAIRDALRDLKKLDLPDGAATILASITTAGNHLPDIAGAMDAREADNAKLRSKVADLEAAVPADGSVILSKADADALTAYRELGQLEELKLKAAGFDEAIATANQLKAAAVLDSASRDPEDETRYRYKPSVLEGLLKLNGAALEATDKGHQVKHDDKTVALDEWITEHAGDFAPALTASDAPAGKPAGRQPGNRQHTDKKQGVTDEQIKARNASELAF